MIELYYWPTPNGHKITLFLEESGLPYIIKPVNIGKGEQFEPAFLKISPNNRMPAIVDTKPADGGEPVSVFESGAILQYLAEKTGHFLPRDVRGRATVMEWLFWQVGGLGPMLGQNHHFSRYAPEKIPYAIDRYVRETRRLYGVLDTRLEGRDFIAGSEYSIADMAAYPWIVPYENQGMKLEDFPQLKRWFERIGERDATRHVVLTPSRRRFRAEPICARMRKHGDIYLGDENPFCAQKESPPIGGLFSCNIAFHHCARPTPESPCNNGGGAPATASKDCA